MSNRNRLGSWRVWGAPSPVAFAALFCAGCLGAALCTAPAVAAQLSEATEPAPAAPVPADSSEELSPAEQPPQAEPAPAEPAAPVAGVQPAGVQPALPDSGFALVAAMEDLLTQAIARAEPSVVAIARVRREGDLAGFPREDLRADFFPSGPVDAPAPADPDFVPREFGTGVIVDAAGLVLTNYHVLGDDVEQYEYWIRTVDSQESLRAEIRGADPRSDLAVLAIVDPPRSVGFTPIVLGDAGQLRKGQIVIALGNPYAIARDGQASASWGIVANLGRKAAPQPDDLIPRGRRDTLHHFGTLIQTDAKLNLGTSGGPLLNLRGEMIGLTTSQAALAGYEQSAGYAIPVDETFLRVVEKLKRGEEVDYGLLGIMLPQGSPSAALGGVRGVPVEGVVPYAFAREAGLTEGDLITHVDGDPVPNTDALMLAVGRRAAGDEVEVTLLRYGHVVSTHVLLAKFPVHGPRIVTSPQPAWRGLQVDYPTILDEEERQTLWQFIPLDVCVLVAHVAEDSPAWEAGLRRGMLITDVGSVPVKTPDEFYRLTSDLPGDVSLRMMALSGEPAVRTVPAAE